GDSRKPEGDSRKPEGDSRKPEGDSRKPKGVGRVPEGGCRNLRLLSGVLRNSRDFYVNTIHFSRRCGRRLSPQRG
ncbi:MAG: hypothetical protein J6W63_10920, partial [Treponema sp.]|nr:hypothetical protein [Treponema sp.]